MKHKPEPLAPIQALVVFRDPATNLTITPTLFAQLPERDFMDHETGLAIPAHTLHGRVVWHGKVWLIFTSTEDPVPVIYRYQLTPEARPQIVLESDNECYRLARVVEAIRVRNGQFDRLPVRLKVSGKTLVLAMYSHSCLEVRYPYLGVTPDNGPGAAKREAVERWLMSQGFVATITEPEVIGLIESVITAITHRVEQWNTVRAKVASTGQLFLHPEADEVQVQGVLDALRRQS